MRLSDAPGYRDYMRDVADGNYDAAKRNLYKCIEYVRGQDAAPYLAGLIQNLGTLYFKLGDVSAAKLFHELADFVDKDSLLTKYTYAKFLLEELGDAAAAASKCDEIIAVAIQSHTPETDSDFSSQEYLRAAQELKSKCLGQSAANDPA